MDAYAYQAALLCEPCAKTVKQRIEKPDVDDSDTYPQGPYADGGGEADTPQHCTTCLDFLENPLTTDGQAYVIERIIDGSGATHVLDEWRTFYDYLDICDECLAADISGPGKFEGEPIETYHAYHVMLDGAADASYGSWWRVRASVCHESSDGFVSGDHFDTEPAAIDYWTREVEPTCFDDDCDLAHEDQQHKPCQAAAHGSPCEEYAQDDKRYCTFHLAQIEKLAQSGRLP